MEQKVDQHVVLYLNLFIQDASEAIKAKVAKSLSRFPTVVQQKAGQRASKVTTPDRIAKQVSPRLIRQLSERMKKKGVTVDIKEIFQDGFYLVFEICVRHVDSFILANGFSGISGFIQWFISGMGHDVQKMIEEDYLPRQILGTLQRELPPVLIDEMREEKIVVETKIHIDSKAQDEYFEAKKKESNGAVSGQNRKDDKVRRPLLLGKRLKRCSTSYSSFFERDMSKAMVSGNVNTSFPLVVGCR